MGDLLQAMTTRLFQKQTLILLEMNWKPFQSDTGEKKTYLDGAGKSFLNFKREDLSVQSSRSHYL